MSAPSDATATLHALPGGLSSGKVLPDMVADAVFEMEGVIIASTAISSALLALAKDDNESRIGTVVNDLCEDLNARLVGLKAQHETLLMAAVRGR